MRLVEELVITYPYVTGCTSGVTRSYETGSNPNRLRETVRVDLYRTDQRPFFWRYYAVVLTSTA